MRAHLVIACLLALLAPAAAHAQNPAIETGARGPHMAYPGGTGSVVGPFIAGQELVWAEIAPSRSTVAVVAAGPSGRRVLGRYPYEGEELFLDVDEGRVALSHYTRQQPPRFVLRAGPVTGPLAVVEGTCGFSPFVAEGALGVGCPASLIHENAVEVHEAAGVRRYLTRTPEEAEIEGDLIGVHQENPARTSLDLVVRRRSTGEEVLRVHRETGPFDLAADGTVAYTWAYRTRQVRIASPRRPRPRVIDGLPFAPDEARLRGDRIAVWRHDASGFENTAGRFISRLAVLDRSTGRVVASHSVRRAEPGWDFDGERFAWTEKPCMRSYVMVWDADERPPPAPAAPCVHARPQGVARLGADRMLRMQLACPTGRRECGGYVRATVRIVDERGRVRDVHNGSDSALIARDPGERWTATWRLNSVTLAAVRRARHASVRATVSRVGGDDTTYSYGGSEPREQLIPLVRG